MEIIRSNQKNVVEKAVEVLKSGGIIVYPTETVYGIGVDATNQKAVDRLMEYKTRREGKPLSVAVTDKKMAEKYVELNDIAENLYENYLPGPITVVSNGRHQVARGVESETGTLGIRIPAHQPILTIVEKFGKPVTSTSANVSYQPRPYSIEQLLEKVPESKKPMLDLIIDAGELPKNDPSTVVDTTLNNLNIMREGTLKFDEDISDDQVVLKASTKNPLETSDFGSLVMLKYIDVPLDSPLILALRGELGAGKTQFVKGVAKALKIPDTISSPTYTIIDEYSYKFADRKGKLIHADTWRVAEGNEFGRIGLKEEMVKNNVIAVEWADKFYKELLDLVSQYDAKLLKVDFEYKSISERELKVYEEI